MFYCAERFHAEGRAVVDLCIIYAAETVLYFVQYLHRLIPKICISARDTYYSAVQSSQGPELAIINLHEPPRPHVTTGVPRHSPIFPIGFRTAPKPHAWDYQEG